MLRQGLFFLSFVSSNATKRNQLLEFDKNQQKIAFYYVACVLSGWCSLCTSRSVIESTRTSNNFHKLQSENQHIQETFLLPFMSFRLWRIYTQCIGWQLQRQMERVSFKNRFNSTISPRLICFGSKFYLMSFHWSTKAIKCKQR